MHEGKLQAQRTWGASPTGAVHARVYEPGTREYFETADAWRKQVEQPWLRELVPFGEMRDRRVLEIGFGPGFDTLAFLQAGADYTGIDITPENVERTKKHMAFYGYAPDVRQGDAEALEFPDAGFDVVYSNGVLHHTPDMPQAFREVWRVLKPGGRFYVILYHRNSVVYRLSTALSGLLRGRSPAQQLRHIEMNAAGETPIVNVYSRRELDGFLRETGFAVEAKHVRKLLPEDFPFASRLGGLYRRIPQSLLDTVGRRWGWYVIAVARK